MRVVIVATHPIQHFCPQYRSIARHAGIDLTVVFDSLKGVEEYRDEGFDRAIQWGPQLVNGFDWISLDRSGRNLSETLDQCAPEWLIVYGYSTPVAKLAWRWATTHPVRLAYISDSELRHKHSRLNLVLKRLILGVAFRRVDLFLSIGDANHDYYRRMGVPVNSITQMHFPIDVQEFEDAHVSPELLTTTRNELDISDDAVVITMVGKLIGRKRQKDLIDACRGFSRTRAHLLLVGSGPDHAELCEYSRSMDNVTLVGFVPPNELRVYYDLTDVYAHVSSYDPHPLAISEALASGCSLVVSSSTGSWGPNDDVREFKNGMVVETGNTKALHDALEILVDDPAMREEFSLTSRKISRMHQQMAHGDFIQAMEKISDDGEPSQPLARLLRR